MQLGMRVVRGPDWEWKNQDGGEGSAGTVVKLGQQDEKSPSRPQLVWVQWDCGTKASYRAGIDGKHDLRVLDNANVGVRHVHVLCDGCGQDPIVGMRWHCLGCPNFDLCTTCYMTDQHNLHHPFERIDKTRAKGVPVGGRFGSTKLEVRGIFKGANVARGPDWKYKNQDGGSECEGVVIEITDWDNDSKRDAARVSWQRGQRENIYRIGREGKVDLKCTRPVVGGTYYRDHLPPMTMEIKKTKGSLTTGDKVYAHVTQERLKQLSADHGGWNKDMEKFIGVVGVVNDFTPSGDVLVEYPNRRWRYNPEALTKVPSFKRGDEVLVKSDRNLVKELQQGHGGWNEAMISILGRTGKVVEVDGNGDLMTLVEDGKWILNPAAVTYVTDPKTSDGLGSCQASGGSPSDGADFLARLLSDLFQQQSGGSGNSSRELINACRNNRLSRVREILDANPEKVNEMEGGHTALQVASHEGNCDVMKLLLDRGAHRDAMDTQGYTAMHHATYGCIDASAETLKLFDIVGRDRSGEALKLLLERGLNPNDEVGDTPLFDAISQEENGIVDLIIANPRLSMTVANRGGFNYLHYACLKGNAYAVEKLLERAGDVLDVPKSDGFSSLHIAAINDHRNEAKLLLRKGCAVDARSEKWQTPLHLAATEGYSAMVELLLDHGADVNAEDVDGDTALHISLAKESLFKAGLDAPSLQLLLQLHTGQSDSESYASVSRFLLTYGANVNHFNGRGETPSEKCSGSGVEALVLEIAAFGGIRVEKFPTFSAVGRAKVAPNGLNTASGETRPNEEWEGGGQESASFMNDFDNRDNQERTIGEDNQSGATANGNHQTTCDVTLAKGNDVSQEPCQQENTCQGISGEAGNDGRTSTYCNEKDTNQEYSNVENDQSESSQDVSFVDNLRETLENVKENIVVKVTNQEASTDDELENYRNVEQENEEMGTAEHETCEENGGKINDELPTVQEPIPCASLSSMEEEMSTTEECDVSTTEETTLLSEGESKGISAEDKEKMKEESARGDVGRGEEVLTEPVQQERAGILDVSTDSNGLQCQICDDELEDYRNVEQENEEMGTAEHETCEENGGKINDELPAVQEPIPCASLSSMEEEMSTTEECDVSTTEETTSLSEGESKGIYAEDKEKMKEESARGDISRGEEVLTEPVQQERAGILDVSTDSNGLQCQICEEYEADVVFKPCGHSIVCTECSSRLKRCLECKTTITARGRRDGEPISGLNNKSMTVMYQLLEGKLRQMEEIIVCCICVERKKNVFFPCGHGTCKTCAEQLRVCPICQKRIDKKLTVF